MGTIFVPETRLCLGYKAVTQTAVVSAFMAIKSPNKLAKKHISKHWGDDLKRNAADVVRNSKRRRAI